MNEDKQLHALIDSIYEAAVDPAQYQVFLQRLSVALRGAWTLLLAHDTRAWQSSIELSAAIDPSVVEAANRYYAAINPFIARGRAFMQPGRVIVGENIVPDSELVRTEFYNDHLRPNDLYYTIGGTITLDQFGAALFSGVRSKRKGPFTTKEIQLVKALDPHLRRALQIQKKLDLLEGQRDALDRIPIGCILLGRGGRVLVTNRAAENILRRKDGLAYSAGQLTALAPVAASRLKDLIRAVSTPQVLPHCGGIVAIPVKSQGAPYSVLVAPLAKRPFDWGGFAPIAIVLITDSATQTSGFSILEKLYDLTPAEARLAGALINGQGLQHAAEELGISTNTGKTQLQSIFAKTHTGRQAELIRQLTGAMLLKDV